MAERKSGPVKPPVIDLKARDASAAVAKPTAKAAEKPAEKAVKPESKPDQAPVVETTTETVTVKETVEAPKPKATEPKAEPAEAKAEAAEPTPEPVRPTPTPPTPPTPPPVRQAKLAMPWSAISIAAIAGALLGTALTYTLVNLVPLPSAAPVIEDPAERLSDLDGRLGALEDRVPALEESSMKTQVSLDATITQLDTGLGDLRTALSGLETRISEVQSSIPAAAEPVDLGPITAQLDTLESRVTAIAAGASSADAAVLAENLTAMEASIAALTTRLDAADARLAEIDNLRGELETAKAAIAAQTQTLGGADIGPAVKLPLILSGLETALATGRPYGAELQSLKTLLPDLAVPASVEAAAATGLPRADTLAADFRANVPAILAGRTAESTGDWGQDAIEWAKALLAFRPAGELEGDAPEAIVSRLEAAVERHDFVAAAALLDQLPEPMQAAAGDTGTAIRAHASAAGFVASLRAQALGSVAEASQ
ncbi:MAG TPA: hypothetical protein VIN06_09530 [Devosia sp.]